MDNGEFTNAGPVSTSNIINGAVTTEKLADGAVTLDKIAHESVDDEPTAGSNNLVNSGGVANKLAELEKFLLVFVGRNNEGYDIPINNLIPGHKYRVFIPSKWDISGITLSYVGWQMFNLYKKKEEQQNELKVFYGTTDFNAQWYEFEAEEGYEYYIYARATKGIHVKFNIEDVDSLSKVNKMTEKNKELIEDLMLKMKVLDDGVTKEVHGHGNSQFSPTNLNITLKAGVKYYINIKCESPVTNTGSESAIGMLQITGDSGIPTFFEVNKEFSGKSFNLTTIVTPETDTNLFLYDRILQTDIVIINVITESVMNEYQSSLIDKLIADVKMNSNRIGENLTIKCSGSTNSWNIHNLGVKIEKDKKYVLFIKVENPIYAGPDNGVSAFEIATSSGKTILSVDKTKIDSTGVYRLYTATEDDVLYINERLSSSSTIQFRFADADTSVFDFLCNKIDEDRESINNLKDGLNCINDTIKNFNHNIEFVGEGKTFVSKELDLARNRTYALIPINPDWNKEGCFPGWAGTLLEGYAKLPSGNVDFIAAYIFSDTEYHTIQNVYIFKTDIEDALSYNLGLRAANGEIVKFNLIDVTEALRYNEEWFGKSIVYNGHGKSSWSSIKTDFSLKKGETYIISVESDDLQTSASGTSIDIIQICGEGGEPTLLGVDIKYVGKHTFVERTYTPSSDMDLYLFDKVSESSNIKITVILATTPLYKNILSEIQKNISINDVINRNKVQIERVKSMGLLPSDIRSESIPNLVFLHISDTHAPNLTADQIPNAVKVLNELSKNEGSVKFLLHTGDVRYDIFPDDYSFFTNSIRDAEKPVFVVPGNHDCGWTKVSESGTDEQIFHQMIEPMLESWNLVTSHGGNPHIEGKNYYFKDFDTEKIRMICLYEFETDFAIEEDGETLVNPRHSRAFRQSQIDWFVESLYTVPDGYGVLVVKHQPEDCVGETNTPFNSTIRRGAKHKGSFIIGEIIAEIVDAFMNKQIINKTYVQNHHMQSSLAVNADFSSVTGEFVAYVSGHTHRDHVSFLKNFPRQLELNIGANNTGYNSGQDIRMKVGEKSQDIINMYSIDMNNGVIHIARIGGDYACTGQYRQFDTLKFRI